MNNILNSIMKKHPMPVNDNQAKNVIKQILQEIILCGLGRSDFFRAAAFNGGTALRIFHGLPRFSEDLDFSVDSNAVATFSLSQYTGFINNELESLGLPACFEIDSEVGTVKRGYVKGNCLDILKCFDIEDGIIRKIASNEIIKVKLEADCTYLKGASFETKFLLQPYPTPIRLYDRASLFAGKLDAVLSRSWKNRVKGRDLYDFLFYVGNNCPINYPHLESRLKSKSFINENTDIYAEALKKMLCLRFEEIDYDSAKNDVVPFIYEAKEIYYWSKELFVSVTEDYFTRNISQ